MRMKKKVNSITSRTYGIIIQRYVKQSYKNKLHKIFYFRMYGSKIFKVFLKKKDGLKAC